jgi:hypothetical protein
MSENSEFFRRVQRGITLKHQRDEHLEINYGTALQNALDLGVG